MTAEFAAKGLWPKVLAEKSHFRKCSHEDTVTFLFPHRCMWGGFIDLWAMRQRLICWLKPLQRGKRRKMKGLIEEAL